MQAIKQILWTLGPAAITAVHLASSAGAITFQDDGTFSPATWSETILGNSDVIDTSEATGGNPGAFLRTETVPSGGVIVHGAYLNSAATWNPSVQGAIASIDMALDVILFRNVLVPGFFDGQAYGIAALQGGVVYRSGYPVTGLQFSGFDPRTILGVTAAGFTEILPDGTNGPGALDFSTTGGLITFGFLVANSGSAPISGTIAGYDNWAVTVNPVLPGVPLPAGLPLLLSGVLILALRPGAGHAGSARGMT